MNESVAAAGPARLAIAGFAAGFAAVPVFHQIVLGLLWVAGIAPFGPFPTAPVPPFGVPAVLSLAFWGGVWGVVLAFASRRFPAGAGGWVAAFLFGAILPSLVALLVVVPLKGGPVGGGWHPALLATAFLINGAWGIGTALLLRPLARLGGAGA